MTIGIKVIFSFPKFFQISSCNLLIYLLSKVSYPLYRWPWLWNVSKGIKDQHDKHEKPFSILVEDFDLDFTNKNLEELEEILEELEALKKEID